MNNNECLSFHPLSNRVLAFSSTRHGGYGKGAYGSFNVNPYVGDEEEAVQQNIRLLCRHIAIKPSHLIFPHQTHETEIRVIGKEFLSLPPATRAMILESVDGLVTNIPNSCIGVSTADCIPILLYDEAQHIGAAVHAGWRGTVKRIAEKAVQVMQTVYHTRPCDIKAYIGPGISVDNFEVGNEVYDQFAAAGFAMNEIARREEKWHINLPECNRLQLQAVGVLSENIVVSPICTYQNVADYFSARQLGTASGRIFTGIKLL